MDARPPPKLDQNNFDFWYQALCNAAIITEAKEHVTTDPPSSTDPAQLTQFHIKQAKVRDMIMKSIPPSKYNQVNPSIFSANLHEIFAIIKKHVNSTSPHDHELLKEEARAIQFTPEKTL